MREVCKSSEHRVRNGGGLCQRMCCLSRGLVILFHPGQREIWGWEYLFNRTVQAVFKRYHLLDLSIWQTDNRACMTD